jgi:hypothetical protein
MITGKKVAHLPPEVMTGVIRAAVNNSNPFCIRLVVYLPTLSAWVGGDLAADNTDISEVLQEKAGFISEQRIVKITF